MTTFSTQSRMIFHRACGNDSYVDICFLVCPSILPFICMTCYDFDAFLYMVFDFLCDILHMAFQKLESLQCLFSVGCDHSFITYFMCFQ